MGESINSTTHFNWGETQKEAIERRTGTLRTWDGIRYALQKYIEALNRDYDRNGLGIQFEYDQTTMKVSLGLFELRFLRDRFCTSIFYAFVSPALRTVRPNESDIWNYGEIRVGEYGIGFDPLMTYWDGTKWKEFNEITEAELRSWPMADRIARWSLEKLIGGEHSICNWQSPVKR